ncbi:hypothetical protein [Abyssisolibacter fermentans]|uniref:hypothetical protein n=1 Tax=Abyssisolibacter fermentans TaxID=1766203 RepID=UPI0012E3671B|nr:hypothetical protein [Abyssisolibacter fermentans]
MKQLNNKSLEHTNDREPNWCIWCDASDRCDSCDAIDFGNGDCNSCDFGTECTKVG